MFTYMTDKLHAMLEFDSVNRDWYTKYVLPKKVESKQEAIDALKLSNGWNLALIPLEIFKEDEDGELLKYTTLYQVQCMMASYPQLKKCLPVNWETIIRRNDLKRENNEKNN